MQDGRITARVAIIAPNTPATLCPTKLAALIAIGPGVICEIVIRSVKSLVVIQWYRSTTWPLMRGMAAYPPPKEKAPICRNARNNSK